MLSASRLAQGSHTTHVLGTLHAYVFTSVQPNTWNVLMSASADVGGTRESGAGGPSGRVGVRTGDGATAGAACGTGMFCALLREMAVQLTSLRARGPAC